MKSFFDWFRERGFPADRPWLILGKGPSFAKRTEYDLGSFCTLGLNHVPMAHPVTVGHAIDIEVLEQCGEDLPARIEAMVMPWVPHERYTPLHPRVKVAFRPSDLNLEQYCERHPLLKRLDSEGRLLWYNLSTAPRGPRPGGPVVSAHGFSSTVALNLLAEAGVRKVRSLGIDGGRKYSQDFGDLEKKTMVLQGQLTYDIQFQGFADTILKRGVDFAPLDVQSPAKVFVGTEPEQMLPFKVLEYSIRRRCSLSVEVAPLFQAIEKSGVRIPEVEDPKIKPRTPFSFQRFAIPQLAGREGRAIYLDSDMLVLRDLRELWTWPFEGAQILSVREPEGTGRRSQYSVMVLDCKSLGWDVADLVGQLQAGKWTYEQFVYELAPASSIGAVLPPEWNDLERYREGTTALVHFTDMDIQPWLETTSLLGRRWCEELFSALSEGFITREEIADQIERGWVRPSLDYQLEHGIVDPLLLPPSALKADRMGFVPPPWFKARLKGVTSFGRRPSEFGAMTRRAYATARHLWKSSGAGRFLRRLRRRLW